MIKINLIKLIAVTVVSLLPLNVNAELVNINAASSAAISHHLKGIGEKKANALVSYREQHGDFEDVNDITNVKGIGEGLLEKNFDDLSLTEGVVKLVVKNAKHKTVVIDSVKPVNSGKLTSKAKVPEKIASAPAKDLTSMKVKKKKLILDLPKKDKVSDLSD